MAARFTCLTIGVTRLASFSRNARFYSSSSSNGLTSFLHFSRVSNSLCPIRNLHSHSLTPGLRHVDRRNSHGNETEIRKPNYYFQVSESKSFSRAVLRDVANKGYDVTDNGSLSGERERGREGGAEQREGDRSTLEAAMEGGEGDGLLAFYSDHEEVQLPEGHRFPMDKYRKTRLMLESDASLSEIVTLRPSPLASYEELTRVHDPEYVRRVTMGELSEKEVRATGFPWSPQMVRRSYASTGGTVSAMHAVMLGRRQVAGHVAGGTHHAFQGHGEGFCVFNDIAVAAAAALLDYGDSCHVAAPVLVLDLDVHQGNGTAKLFESNDSVITFSMHGANNYPWRTKMKSNYDVEFADNTEDDEYLDSLKKWLPRLFDTHNPSLVFFQAGVDALKEDTFGRLSMTRQGLLSRNHLVYSYCMERSVPLVLTMGGGYSKPSDASILAHADVYRSAAYRYGSKKQPKTR